MASDYDGAWKDLLRRRLREALQCFFPEVASAIDWSVAPEFLEQELRSLSVEGLSADNRVDMLVKVATRDGKRELVYLHLEVQSFKEEGFEERVFRCFHMIRARCGPEVVTLAVLADLDAGWKPAEYRHERLGCEVRFRYPCCKLLEILPRLEGDDSLPALAACAQIEALRTSRHPDKRLAARWLLTRRLLEKGYDKAAIREAIECIARMMRLPAEQLLKFRRQLAEYGRENAMPVLTDIEEYAMEQGLQKGLQKGRQEGQILAGKAALVDALEARFDEVPEGLRQAIDRIRDPARLRELLRLAVRAGDLAAFSKAL